MQDEREAPRNWAQVRERIDSGATGDKVAAEDPAAAPLGTDAEAGGSGTAAGDIAASARAEQAHGTAGGPKATASGAGRRPTPLVLVAVGVIVAVLTAVLVASL